MYRKLALIAGGWLAVTALAAPSVEMQTSMGDRHRARFRKAPKTVQNFVQYVNEGFYNGTFFTASFLDS
jgi:hypothetical protein